MLNWLKRFSIFCLLDNGAYSIAPHHYNCLAAAGVTDFIEGDDIKLIDSFSSRHQWVFGHLAYTLKERLHGLPSSKKSPIGFPPYYFFSPQIVLDLKDASVIIYAAEPDEVFNEISKEAVVVEEVSVASTLKFALTKEAYLEKVHQLQQHILRGDCYEVNFCIESSAIEANFNPFAAYQRLIKLSPNPFAAFYRVNDKYLLCASPERFLIRKGNQIFSQPIKGTIARNINDAVHDEALKTQLQQSKKDQSENVMVVDLVRNDLTKICRDDSVKVEELFGVYSFPQVHQMISTISGHLKEDTTFSEIIETTFPMGSMTGAPKHRVMELIEDYEPSARGIFSGSVGYINPDGDFDFNVVIRSIMYNATSNYLSYQVGSGITFYSDAEKEWEECMLKAEAIKKVLAG